MDAIMCFLSSINFECIPLIIVYMFLKTNLGEQKASIPS